MLIFRLPNKDKYFTTDDSKESIFYTFHSFDGGNILNFPGKIVAISKEEILAKETILPKYTEIKNEENKHEYIKKINSSIDIIREYNLPKLVVARKKIVQYTSIHFTQTFFNLCKNYPNAFVYAFIKDGIAWMGAFSEILGIYDKTNGDFQTTSIAGTIPIAEEWTKKEIEEQKPVTEFIHSILQEYSSDIETSGISDHISGNIKHLKTNFRINLAKNKLEEILDRLHPTPAVCGIPKDLCKEKIKNLEKFDREYYAGYTKIEMEDKIYAFVNLRCGKFYNSHVELFVGGGITKDSIPEKEWQETELKSQALIHNLEIKKLT
jgi:isochorismate synthase